MNKTKLYISSTLFILITLLKFAFPSLAEDLKSAMIPALTHDTDYRSAMTDLGKSLSGEDSFIATLERMIIRDGNEDTSAADTGGAPTPKNFEPVTIGELHRDFTAAVKSEPEETDAPEETEAPAATEVPAVTEAPVATEAPEVTAAPTEDPGIPDAVEVFLESQAKFEGYSLPVNVSADMPVLPFEFTSPVSGVVSSGFGYRMHPIDNEVKFHYGTDIAAYVGTQIVSFADGTVVNAGENDSYGKYLIIGHEGGYKTLYAHCSDISALIGQTVTKGQQIAKVGETGDVTGPHLHFELIYDLTYMNPEYYINSI